MVEIDSARNRASQFNQALDEDIKMSKNRLEISIDLEEYTAGLLGRLNSNEFSGFGEGWFNLIDIKEFIEKISKMLNTLNGTANLVGSQNKADGSEYLERFGLRCYPIGSAGTIGIHVTLTDYPFTDCRPEEVYKVSGEIKTNVELANIFISELSELISGSRTMATLVARE